ncbi:carbon-nitrogen hydrolase family protein [Maridesulfovibrio ferrireducens]|uniref:carbon-nitrogen hydrolase family protein n=1 Tax=Maridesulfovibrio ferrireducens TaxID=246191 RepID=UPI001A240904|nr:carbon-nitrogen hydrolase family protein [Maridesulfovibrio ferrireducens]
MKTLIALFLSMLLPIVAFAGAPTPDCCTPDYNQTVLDGYRKLKVQSSVYQTLPPKGKGLRLGIYQAQADYGHGASLKNMNRLEKVAQMAKNQGVQLLAFPELYVTGYTLSPDEAKKVAEFSDGPSITRAKKIAAKLNMAMLVPYAEKVKTKNGFLYFDSIAVINEKGELATSYKKTHLYGQQERDNWSFGSEPPPVFKTFGFPVGVLNCYENEFPELSRILALNGAKLIVGPTAADCYYRLPNGKRSAVPYPDISTVMLPAYAYANNVFFAYANRAGYEKRGNDEWHYRGNSIIISPHGDVIIGAGHQQDTLLISDCIPEYYGMTHPAPKYNYLRDRRPDLYAPLTAPKANLPGGWTYPTFKDGKEIGREQ